jgi:hypothetical protein
VDGKLVPLLVADSVVAPRFAVLLADTTWKWARHRDSEIRRDYEEFWSRCFKWLGERERSKAPIVLEVEPLEESDVELRGWVRPALDRRGALLSRCRVSIRLGGREAQVETEERRGRHRFRHSWKEEGREDVESGVVWLQAFAELDGKEVASERVPVACNRHLEELARVQPAAEVLRGYTTGETGSFAWYPDRAAVIAALLEVEAAPVRTTMVRKRDSSRELLIAVLAFLALGAEWWMERRARRRHEEAQEGKAPAAPAVGMTTHP